MVRREKFDKGGGLCELSLSGPKSAIVPPTDPGKGFIQGVP